MKDACAAAIDDVHSKVPRNIHGMLVLSGQLQHHDLLV